MPRRLRFASNCSLTCFWSRCSCSCCSSCWTSVSVTSSALGITSWAWVSTTKWYRIGTSSCSIFQSTSTSNRAGSISSIRAPASISWKNIVNRNLIQKYNWFCIDFQWGWNVLDYSLPHLLQVSLQKLFTFLVFCQFFKAVLHFFALLDEPSALLKVLEQELFIFEQVFFNFLQLLLLFITAGK